MFIPGRENYTDITPVEFEQYVLSTLQKQFHNQGINDFCFKHNTVKDAADGQYQIDGEITMTVMGVNIDFLIECKMYKGPIKREHIAVLYDKIRAIGAHKGIFVTTSYYQSGALKYANEHGIALISVIDGKMQYETRGNYGSKKMEPPPWVNVKPYVMVLQTQTGENSITVSIIDDSDYLVKFITQETGGENS